MKTYFKLFSVLYKNQNVRLQSMNGKRKLPPRISNLLGYIPIVVLLCGVCGFMATSIHSPKGLASLCTAIMTAAQVMALFLTMFNVMTTLYDAPDIPFLNTLPIKHTTVFFAKFTLVYVNTLEIVAFTLIPTMLTLTIVYAALGGVMFYGFFPLIIVIALLAPILPLFVLTLFTMPMSYAGSFFKSNPVVKTILSLIAFIIVMAGYFVFTFFVSSLSSKGTELQISQSAFSGLYVFSNVMYPNKVLIDLCLGISPAVNFGISAGILIGMIAIMLLLSMLFYRRIEQRRLESHAETTHKQATFKQSSAVAALLSKDVKSIFRNSHMALSCFGNLALCPVVTVLMYFVSGLQGGDMPESGAQMLKLNYLVLYSMIFLGGTNVLAMIAYTREGQSFYISRVLPIKPKDSVLAKLIVAVVPVGIILIFEMIIGLALYKLSIWNVLLYMLTVVLGTVGAIALHIYCDMRFGNVNWSTRQDMQQSSKQNKGTFGVVFGLLGATIIGMVLGMVLTNVPTGLSEVATYAIYWTVQLVMATVILIVGLVLLINNGTILYDKIGEKQFIPRTPKNPSPKIGKGLIK